MGNFYFDMQDSASPQDTVGLEFPSAGAAIAHGRDLVRRLRGDPWIDDTDLYISIVDEFGREIYRENVYNEPDSLKSSATLRLTG